MAVAAFGPRGEGIQVVAVSRSELREMARARGMVAFGIVVMPFSSEVGRRELANEGVAQLRMVTENTIVLDANEEQCRSLALDRRDIVGERITWIMTPASQEVFEASFPPSPEAPTFECVLDFQCGDAQRRTFLFGHSSIG